jgi:hypothetical protein
MDIHFQNLFTETAYYRKRIKRIVDAYPGTAELLSPGLSEFNEAVKDLLTVYLNCLIPVTNSARAYI